MDGRVPHRGFTIIELIVVMVILGVLATAAVPFAEFVFIREKEEEFRINMHDIRVAISRFRADCEKSLFEAFKTDLKIARDVPEKNLYPKDITDLTNSNPFIVKNQGGDEIHTFYHQPYLHKIPDDPFVGGPAWVQHYSNAPQKSTTTYLFGVIKEDGFGYFANVNVVGVFDVSGVATPSIRRGFVTAIDGTKYSDW